MPEGVYRPPESVLTAEPDQRGLSEPGEFSVRLALSDGWNAMLSSFPLWLGALIVAALLVVGSIFTVIGIFLLVPVIVWGSFVLGLKMFDGGGQLSDLFSGFEIYIRAVGYMLAFFLLSLLISLPGQAAAQFIAMSDPGAGTALLSQLANMAWSVVTLRFFAAPFFMVDQQMRPLESFGASWRFTEGQWGRLILLWLASIPIALLGVLALGVGLLPASAVVAFAYVSAYRQITRTRVAPY
jgi:uncharacterized membrane protein